MLDQTFALSDIPRIFTLSFLELLLSADNAIVLAIITHRLAPHLRRKALYIGVASSFLFRAVGLLSLSYLLQYDWVQMFGAAYLVYLALNHFLKKRKFKEDSLLPSSTISFWKTVLLIELFDLAFAIDSIIAGVAFITDTHSVATFHPKLWIVYFGGMLGLIGTRYAADLFSSLIGKFPRLETSAYLMIAWIGLKLGLSSLDLTPTSFAPLFWLVIALLFLSGFTKKKTA
jgi:YkoY family integral membrane protein